MAKINKNSMRANRSITSLLRIFIIILFVKRVKVRHVHLRSSSIRVLPTDVYNYKFAQF